MKVSLRISIFADGPLARAGHDLVFSVDAEVTVDEQTTFALGDSQVAGRVLANVDMRSIRYLGVRRGSQLDASGLAAADVQRVERSARTDVLHVERFPEAVFRGQLDAGTLQGRLLLCGREAPLSGRWAPGGSAHFELTPSEHGIAPFRALMGALRVKDRVLVDLPKLGATD